MLPLFDPSYIEATPITKQTDARVPILFASSKLPGYDYGPKRFHPVLIGREVV